jgi:hypothetical protein
VAGSPQSADAAEDWRAYDWRNPVYGIRWPPSPDNPVKLSVIWEARRAARVARRRAEADG